jgi:hypothetical protein
MADHDHWGGDDELEQLAYVWFVSKFIWGLVSEISTVSQQQHLPEEHSLNRSIRSTFMHEND